MRNEPQVPAGRGYAPAAGTPTYFQKRERQQPAEYCPPEPDEHVRILDYFDGGMYQRRSRCNEETLRVNRYRILHFTELMGNLYLWQIDSRCLDEYVMRAEESKSHKMVTIKKNAECVRSIIRYAIRDRFAFFSPDLPRFRLPSPQPHPIRLDILDKFIRYAVNLPGPIRPGFFVDFMTLAYCTGLRVSDLLRVTDEHFDGTTLRLPAGKTGKHHAIPLPDWCARRFKRIKGRWLPINYDYLYELLKIACENAGVELLNPKRLRVTAAYQWQKAGHNCGYVILGHSQPGTNTATPHYLTGEHSLEMTLPRLECPSIVLLTPEEQDEKRRLEIEFDAYRKRMSKADLQVFLQMARKMIQ